MILFLDIETTGDLATWPPRPQPLGDYVLERARAKIHANNRTRTKTRKQGAELEAECVAYAQDNERQLAAGYPDHVAGVFKAWSDTATSHLDATVTTVCALAVERPGDDGVWLCGQMHPGLDERQVLGLFMHELEMYLPRPIERHASTPQVVTWKGTGFDIPILRQRALKYHDEPWARGLALLTDERRHLDLHDHVATRAGARVDQGLRWLAADRVCDALGIERPHPILGDDADKLQRLGLQARFDDVLHGGHLPLFSALGEHDLVATKCRADLVVLHRLYERVLAVFGGGEYLR